MEKSEESENLGLQARPGLKAQKEWVRKLAKDQIQLRRPRGHSGTIPMQPPIRQSDLLVRKAIRAIRARKGLLDRKDRRDCPASQDLKEIKETPALASKARLVRKVHQVHKVLRASKALA